MDYNHPDHFQMTPPMIKLQSSDGEIFQVEVKVAKLSLMFKEMLDDLGVIENEVLPIPPNGPEISGEILRKIMLWANHHKDDPAVAEEDDKEEKPTDGINSWDVEFLQVDQRTLFQIIQAANYLNVKGLLDVTCKTVAKVIEVMSVEDVRRTFHIQNDFSPAEEQRVREENAWGNRVHFVANSGIPVNRSVMDEIPTNSVQNMNHEDNQVMKDSLSNSVVVRKIFQHCSDNDLLNLSCVNKMWNYEARSVLRKRGNLVARIKCGRTESCREDVEAFLSVIQQMNIVPFSETNIDTSHPRPLYQIGGCPSKGLCPFDDKILDRLPLRKVTVYLHEGSLNSPGFLLAKKILQYFSEALEELTVSFHITREAMKFSTEDVVGHCKFPRLKVLHVHYTNNALHTNFVSELVPRAPCLQQLYTDEPILSAFNAQEGTSAMVVYTQMISAPFDKISEAKIGACKLENIRLVYTGPEFNFERLSHIAPVLLQASSTTIRSMEIDAVLAVPLMCYGIIFDKVKYLEMRINYPELELREPRISRIVKDFDFSRLFPNLSKVTICGGSSTILPPDDTTDRILERANAVLPLLRPDRVANIKTLNLMHCRLSIATTQFFVEAFPHIEMFYMYEYGAIECPFGSIWKYWVGLKHLEILGWMIPNDGNLDSVFCGIFPEEVAELRQKDDEYLKSVHIVPVMPAITCLKNLRVLSLCRRERDGEGYIDDGTFIFSKVTGFIAFKRLPSLAVMLSFWEKGSIPATRHLEPFATVTVK